MKIMHFAGGGDIGGAKTHILSLAKELSAQNDVCVVSFRRGNFSKEAEAIGLKTIVVDSNWIMVRMALKAVDEFRPDIIHCHGAKANMLGVIMKLLRRVPIMTTVHSDPRRDYMGMPIKQHTFGVINALALRNMDYYMAVAGAMEINLIMRGFNPQKIFRLYNGLDFSGAGDIAEPRKRTAAHAADDVIVGIAARLTPIKDIPTLLKAFALAHAKNPKLRLLIAGIGEDDKMLKSLSQQLGIAHRVDFVGWIKDMQSFFSQVDINVLSSLSETFPYSLLEGAYEHCAAVASRVGGIPSLISHGETGYLFEPGDADKLAEYIYELSVDDERRKSLADNLYLRAKAEFSLAKMTEDQAAVYHTIMRRETMKGRQGAVICGAYGRGNAGDDAILQAIISQMWEIDPDMPLTVMSRDSDQIRLVNRTQSIYIFNIFAFIKSLLKSKIFINGGGSLIQDVTSSRSLFFYLFTLWAAKVCGCRVIMYGCGIGPVTSRLNQRIAGGILNRTAEIITLRDSISLTALEQMKVNKPKVLLSADPTINIRKADESVVREALNGEGIPEGIRKICFCLRAWRSFTAPEAIARAAEYAYEKYGLTPVFLPIEYPKDMVAGATVTDQLNIPYYTCQKKHNVETVIGMLADMDLVVSMRLHALVFATAGSVPVVGISYDVKVDSFIKDIGSDACIPVRDLSADALCAEIDRVITSDRAEVYARAQNLRAAERANVEQARLLLVASR